MPRQIHSAPSTWGVEMDKANNNSQELYDFVAALQTALDLKLNANLLGAASGAASLDAGSKLLTSQIPDSILAGLKWQGTWNVTTNPPAIPAAATGNNGWFYKVSVAGTSSITGAIAFAPRVGTVGSKTTTNFRARMALLNLDPSTMPFSWQAIGLKPA